MFKPLTVAVKTIPQFHIRETVYPKIKSDYRKMVGFKQCINQEIKCMLCLLKTTLQEATDEQQNLECNQLKTVVVNLCFPIIAKL